MSTYIRLLICILLLTHIFSINLIYNHKDFVSEIDGVKEQNKELQEKLNILLQSNRYLENQLYAVEAIKIELFEELNNLEIVNQEILKHVPWDVKSFF